MSFSVIIGRSHSGISAYNSAPLMLDLRLVRCTGLGSKKMHPGRSQHRLVNTILGNRLYLCPKLRKGQFKSISSRLAVKSLFNSKFDFESTASGKTDPTRLEVLESTQVDLLESTPRSTGAVAPPHPPLHATGGWGSEVNNHLMNNHLNKLQKQTKFD